MMTNMVRNLIFDVGNVLIGYRWFEMLTEDFGLSSEEANRIGNEMFENDLWGLGLDGGRITLDEAILEYGKLYPQDNFCYQGQEVTVSVLKSGKRLSD